jgi:hypothetical protein
LTVTDVGPPERVREDSEPIEAGCDDPVSGDGTGSLDETIAAARAEPDFAGAWVDGPVLTLALTGDLDRHEREVRAQWGGPLCVVEHARTYADLERLQTELSSSELDVLWSSLDELHNRVELGVVRLTPEQRERLAEHGDAVFVTEALRPVD